MPEIKNSSAKIYLKYNQICDIIQSEMDKSTARDREGKKGIEIAVSLDIPKNVLIKIKNPCKKQMKGLTDYLAADFPNYHISAELGEREEFLKANLAFMQNVVYKIYIREK